MRADLAQKLREVLAEVIVGDAALAALRIFRRVVHVVGWIGEHHVRRLPVQHPVEVRPGTGIAAQHPVRTQKPQISGPGDRIFFHFGSGILIGIQRRIEFVPQPIQFLVVEAQQIEVELFFSERCQFRRQQLVVPPGIQRQAIIDQNVSPFLRFGEMVEHDDGHFGEAQFASCLQPGVPGDYTGIAVDQDGVGEPELADAGRDLCDLLGGVGARIARIGNQPINRPSLNCRR